MEFQSHTYSILVVSAAGKFNNTFSNMLPETTYGPVTFVSNVAAARRLLLDRSYDLVVINAPLPDDFGTKLAIDVCRNQSMVALLLVRADVLEEINDKVLPHGVFTLSKPTSPQTLMQGLQWMASARERLRSLEQKAASINDKMEEIRLVNRAKWLLIVFLSMSEAEAHRYIEKQAMDRCISRREIAQGIIQTYA